MNKHFLSLSKWQKGIFLAEEKDQFSGLYTIHHHFVVEGNICHMRIKSALTQLCRKYPLLRAKLIPECAFVDNPEFIISVNEQNVESTITLKNLLKPIHLLKDSLFQCFLFTIDRDQHLVFSFHHLIFDGWSSSLFYRDFIYFYKQSSYFEKTNTELVTFDIFHSINKGLTMPSNLEEKYIFFKNKLNFCSSLLPCLEYDDNNNNLYDSKLTAIHFDKIIDPHLCKQIKELCTQFKISEYLFYLSCFALCISKISAKKELPICVAYANRDLPGVTRLLTNLVDLIIMSCEIDKNDSFLEIVSKLKKEFIGSLKNQVDFSYFEIVTECSLSTKYPFSNPGFQLFFNFIEIEFSKLDLSECCLNFVEELTSEKHRFEFHFEIRYDKIQSERALRIIYAEELFSSETVSLVSNYYLKWMTTCLQEPKRKNLLSRLEW